MTIDDRGSQDPSATDVAIERALEAANLRAGDALGSTSASVVEEWEPTAAEAGDLVSSADGD
ncbi:hypothetical protein [Agromyces ramosus]|uniref:Uncharacterized protein n=1 Tax=Agromyces ramosus TaxID=33879 RepID=A0ABU0R482_9MICO|nr:hypothetical protein [Agromyces ramosus]MDQ0892879.1 hypothetical protein [Agromyces ramosus]